MTMFQENVESYANVLHMMYRFSAVEDARLI